MYKNVWYPVYAVDKNFLLVDGHKIHFTFFSQFVNFEPKSELIKFKYGSKVLNKYNKDKQARVRQAKNKQIKEDEAHKLLVERNKIKRAAKAERKAEQKRLIKINDDLEKEKFNKSFSGKIFKLRNWIVNVFN